MLKQSQSLRQTQKLIPAVILNQKILTIPTLALDNIIKKELEQNPMLEEAGDKDTDEPYTEGIVSDETDTAEKVTDALQNEASADEDAAAEDTPSDETSIESKINDEYDWDEYFENEAEEYKTYENSESVRYDNSNLGEENSLISGLLLQIHLSDLGAKLVFIAEEIIETLTDDGYFTENYNDIIADLDVKKIGTEFEKEIFTAGEIEEALKFIQYTIDPPGIAARNLIDCLLIQTERSGKAEELKKYAKEVISNHLEDLRLKRFENVAKSLKIDMEKVNEIFEFIHKLNPKPGYIENSGNENFIIPDLIVKKIDGKYEIFLNEKYTPTLRINKTYQRLYSDKKTELDKNTRDYLINNFNKAKWFIDAINSRRETMLKVMSAIIDLQKDFFDNNGEGLRPIYEKEIAGIIRMDNSTISRTVNGKYVQTDFGIYELRSFFTTPVHTLQGEDVSNTEVKQKLLELIENENKNKPLTDLDLSLELNKSGFKVARRTVAKYREAIHIPPAKFRREIKKH